MTRASHEQFEFGEFRLDPKSRALWRGDQRIPLTPKAFDVLFLLVRRAGQVVTRDELISAIWPDSFVEESNLTQTVFMLRKALGEGAGDSTIFTVQGQGYRFAAEVRAAGGGGTGSRRWARWTAAAAVLVVGTLVVLALRSGLKRSQVERGERMMLAVLPFQNLTGDPGQEYFSDGMTEEAITQIGKLDPRYLGVIARTSVMHYKHGHTPLDQIGRELRVQYVLEGSVRRDSEEVRITAKLVQVADQSHLWTREYDRELAHLLALERDIAQDIAAEIQLTLDEDAGTAAASQSGMTPRAIEAYDAYLKGRYHWNKRTPEGFDEAIKHFQLAIEANPDDARAYAGLADCYALLPGYRMVPQSDYMPKARAAAQRALQLNEGLAEAHTSLALIVENYDWDWKAAEREYLRAIELNPNYATAHHWYAEFLAWMGRFDEALRESERARLLDPLSLIIAADNGVILYYSRQYDLAETKLSAVLELEPGFPRGHMVRHVYSAKGDFEKALADIEGFAPKETLSDLTHVLGRAGRMAEAKRALDELNALNERRPVDPVGMAWAYVGMGQNEQALAWLEKGYTQRSNQMLSLKVGPGWDPLRNDPRFQELLRKVGFGGG